VVTHTTRTFSGASDRLPLLPDRVEAAGRRARQTARRNRHTIDPRTLLAAGFVCVLTNLPRATWPSVRVLELYRLRWQVEMRIKALKSLLWLDGLRVQDPDLAQAYLLGKLLGALLVQVLSQQVRSAQPDWWTDTQRPISPWRLTRLTWDVLAETVRGPLDWTMVTTHLDRLRRFLCDEPRQRIPQWLLAQRLVHDLSSC
jgi:hypothetical protein